jgi:small subunit ribosomal protein S7
MPRKGEVPKRKALPDPKYSDAPMEVRRRLTKFVNGVMNWGKKSLAEGIVYGAFNVIADRKKDDPVKIFEKALANVRPKVEVKSRRVGGSTYQVPIEVSPNRSIALAMRWLIGYSRDRTEKTFREKLAAEMMEAAEGHGRSVKKRDDTHKMAEANKAFSHYRW